MESKAESTPVQQITIDFYGNEEYLKQDLLEFMNLFPKELYKGIDEYWDHFLDESFVKKQLSMIEFCKEVYESKDILELRKTQVYNAPQKDKYYLFHAGKFFIQEQKTNHPNVLLNKSNIHFFNQGKNTNFFNEPEFYTSREFLNGNTILLTNGANINLSSSGSGTTAGLTNLSEKFFKSCELIFQPGERLIKSMENIPSYNSQIITPSCITGEPKSFPAGTVFKNNHTQSFPGLNVTIKGVYHIKGIDWKLVNQKKLERGTANMNFVNVYYTTILRDFNESDANVLYLAQIPGEHFLGQQGTLHGLVNAVSDYLFMLKTEKHVIVGMDKPKENYSLKPDLLLWCNLLSYESSRF